MRDDLLRSAEAWANEVLASRWAAVRFRLEPVDESWRRDRALGREHYRVELRVWELAGEARVEADRRGRVVATTFPAAAGDADAGPGAATEAAPAAVLEAARAAAAADRPGARLRVREAAPVPAGRGRRAWRVVVDAVPRDGRLVVDVDPRGPRRLGYRCDPFLRGSRRSAALSRASALARARADLDLPSAARVVGARLDARGRGRVWRLRWELATAEAEGVVAAALNARTGELHAYRSTVAPAAAAVGRPERAQAETELAAAARVRLGEGARVGPLIGGATDALAGGRPAWLAVVRAPNGRLYRASLDAGRVRFRRCG